MSASIFNVASNVAASANTVAQSLSGGPAGGKAVTPANVTANTTGTAPASSTTGDISSNDFLTLLVTEMKNQDPTQPTDPNAYIQQLTEVNSLQQLIAINKDLSPVAPATSGSSASAAVAGAQAV